MDINTTEDQSENTHLLINQTQDLDTSITNQPVLLPSQMSLSTWHSSFTSLFPKNAVHKSITVKTLSFGLNSLCLAIHISLNGKLLAMLEIDGASAGALASTYQSVILGTCVGVLLSSGIIIGPAIGENDEIKVSHIAKTSWLLTVSLGTVSSLAMFGSRFFFPILFQDTTAKLTGDFFTGYCIIGVPILLLITSPQIAFQAGDWYIPPIASFLFMSIAGVSSYFLAFENNMGAFGIGLGGSIAGVVVSAGLQAWFLSPHYKRYRFYQCSLKDFSLHLKELLNTGWQLSLQRLSEWGNLMLITTIIGIKSNKALIASQPSIQYIGLLASTIQGVAQATGMLITQNKGLMKSAFDLSNMELAKKIHKKNVRILVLNNLTAMLINGAIAGGFYLFRKPLAGFFLSKSVDKETRELAETFLWINMVGLVPDAIRIVSGGALRGWLDILYPTLISLLSMTVLGIPIGVGVDEALDLDAEMLFVIRNIFLFLAGMFILHRCYKKLSEDNEEIDQHQIQSDIVDEDIDQPVQLATNYFFPYSFWKSNEKKEEDIQRNHLPQKLGYALSK